VLIARDEPTLERRKPDRFSAGFVAASRVPIKDRLGRLLLDKRKREVEGQEHVADKHRGHLHADCPRADSEAELQRLAKQSSAMKAVSAASAMQYTGRASQATLTGTAGSHRCPSRGPAGRR
jgi:hypothetical protein